MKIAQVAPLVEIVPPITSGGIELVVGLLIDELVTRGHEVTLFASGDSIVTAKLEDEPAYLAFLGRISPEKGPHLAIEIAKATGIPLKMAGKIDPVDVEYFDGCEAVYQQILAEKFAQNGQFARAG